MAISNLVSPGKKMNLPGVSAFFGTQERSANDNVQKISSTMLSDSMVSSIVESLKVFTSEIGRLQETAKKIIRSFVGLIKSLKSLNRDIGLRFKSLSTEMNASRLDFVRNVMTIAPAAGSAGTAMSLEDKFPPLPGEQPKPKPDEPKKDDGRFDFVDALAALLGIKALTKGAATATNIARGLGMAITNPIVAGILGASTSFAAVVFGSAAFGDWLEKKFGIKEKIAEREKTEEYRQLTKAQQDASTSARNAVGETREVRNQNITEFLKSRNLGPAPKGDEIQHKRGTDLVTIIKKGHPDEGKTFNFKTGEEVKPATPAPTAPPAPSAQKATESVRSATDTASSSATGAGPGGENLNVVPPGESVGSPAAPAPAGTPTRAPAGGSSSAPPAKTGEPLNTTTAQHWMLNHPEVAAAYATLSPSDKKKAAEIATTGQESEARNFVMSKANAAKTPAAQTSPAAAQTVRGTEPQGAPSGTPTAAPAPTAPEAPPATPAPSAAGGGEPVVINNNSSQSSESASNTEGNNVSGQNFPMFVADPFIQSYVQRQTPHYQ